MSDEQSKTPRTDEKEFVGQAEWAEDNAPLLGLVTSDFARQLETELGTNKDLLRDSWHTNQKLKQQIETLLKIRAQQEGALKDIKQKSEAFRAANNAWHKSQSQQDSDLIASTLDEFLLATDKGVDSALSNPPPPSIVLSFGELEQWPCNCIPGNNATTSSGAFHVVVPQQNKCPRCLAIERLKKG